MSMYETPSPSKQHSNPDIGIPESHTHINDINPLQLQLSSNLGHGILKSSQGKMVVQQL